VDAVREVVMIDEVLIVAELRPIVDPVNVPPGAAPLMLDTLSV
jgi:hypothetical protein